MRPCAVGLKKKTNFLHHECQDELLDIMARMIQHELVEEIKKAPFFSIVVDGTTDVAACEQVSMCIR